ncbi:hypothetical protein, partial [Okeania sp. SIO1H4]|uniref:hypothetical protein n=1 Tax=Okeania sp. SIO1H4 TaxID=2607776 RepID=UPI00257DA9B7
ANPHVIFLLSPVSCLLSPSSMLWFKSDRSVWRLLMFYWTIVIALDPTYILEGLCAEIVPHFKSAVGNLAN